MTRDLSELVFIGMSGAVIALDRANGQEVWRRELKGSRFVNVALMGNDLVAATRGELYCLDAQSGRIRWNNRLQGMGYGLISIATAEGNNLTAMSHVIQQHKAQAASAGGGGAAG